MRGARASESRRRGSFAALICAVVFFLAEANAQERPKIAVIIDDVGNTLSAGRQALALPGAVTFAFLPQTPHAETLARRAFADGKEVMLHLPMQATEDLPLGPDALTLHMTRAAMERTLDSALASVPHASGVNNHMGSLLTRHPGAMRWLMEMLSERNLFFVDSRTTKETVAETVAAESSVAVVRRHVFLDSDRNRDSVRRQFRRLLHQARRNGEAVAIGHPYPATLAVLAEELPKLAKAGVDLVPASRLTKTYLGDKTWHASSSHSPKVAKNSKPSPSSTCCAAPR